MFKISDERHWDKVRKNKEKKCTFDTKYSASLGMELGKERLFPGSYADTEWPKRNMCVVNNVASCSLSGCVWLDLTALFTMLASEEEEPNSCHVEEEWKIIDTA